MPTVEQLKTLFILSFRATKMYLPVFLVRIDERTKNIVILAGQENKKLHPLLGWSFWAWGMGHGAWGMGKKLPMPCLANAPSDGATIPLQTPGDGVSRCFQ
ncbi:MAG: hypothetical protein V7K27_32660 [Nostoc sp.]|uniref:DUF6888 family protein n=1 Tax=Nostoc sp. TaxID=1180 RepID=UPI002FF69446